MTARRIAAIYRDEHVENPKILTTPEEVDEIINILLESDPGETSVDMYSLDRPSLASGFRTHKLVAGVRSDRNSGVLSSMDGDCDEPNVVSIGNRELGGGPVYYSLLGHGEDFPLFAEISIEKVREAVKEFVSSGGKRPLCVEWDLAGYHDV
jgi:hypothetical protein